MQQLTHLYHVAARKAHEHAQLAQALQLVGVLRAEAPDLEEPASGGRVRGSMSKPGRHRYGKGKQAITPPGMYPLRNWCDQLVH